MEMMKIVIDREVQQLVSAFEQFACVQAIVIGGSHATNQADTYSDYDIYIYYDQELPTIEQRTAILTMCSEHYTVQCEDFGIEDFGVLKNGIAYELIYWNMKEMEKQLAIIQQGNASLGYTTAFWWTVMQGVMLYEQNQCYTNLQQRYENYPDQVKYAIITKNLPMITDKDSSFIQQLEKAIKRDDIISMNHRYTAIIASFTDILFAINKHFHPGEKRLGYWIDTLPIQPTATRIRIEAITKQLYSAPNEAITALKQLVGELVQLCETEAHMPTKTKLK